jgi:hypothetical protein
MNKSLHASVVFFVLCAVAQAFTTGNAGFSVRIGELSSSFDTAGVFLLPGEVTTIVAKTEEAGQAHFQIDGPGGLVPPFVPASAGRWEWIAPQQPGLYPIHVKNISTGESIRLHVFVMTPFNRVRQGMLNGYRIGNYPSARNGYALPKGFIEVTRENEDTLLSPHFRLKQFLCKQGGGYPKYVVLQERLLQKLEIALQGLNQSGHNLNGFEIISGYRTPHYNRAIGNVKYSRHQWGDAADVLVEGISSTALVKTIDHVQGKAKELSLVGGLGKYKRTKRHGPFIHVDVRGHAANW